jgi:phosphomannomutase
MVGYDCRFNGLLFAKLTAARLAQNGAKVLLTPGFVSTPMVSLATAQRRADMGIILTASHNPPEYSGFKLKGAYGGPAYPSVIEEVEAGIGIQNDFKNGNFETLLSNGNIEYYDAEALYINHLKSSFSIDAIRSSGVKIAYDAMYGAGRKVLAKIFPDAHLFHCDNNPGFNGRAPEPIDKNLPELREYCKNNKIPFGLATDGDADRIGLYDDRGVFIDSHHIMLLVANYLLREKKRTGKIVSTFSCTDKIRKFAQINGLPFEVTKIGFKYIAEIMAAEKVLIGGEESGGIAVAGHIPERDGIFIGLLVLEMMAKSGKKISELITDIYRDVGEFAVERKDLHLSEEDKTRIVSECPSLRKFGPYKVQSLENLDGFKYRFGDDRWVMIRPSGTEPVLRVYAESESSTSANDILFHTINTITHKP